MLRNFNIVAIIFGHNSNHINKISYNKYRTRIYAIILIVLLIIECTISSRRHHRRRDLVSASQTKCLDKCSCKWRSGKMTVECLSARFVSIPEGIDSDTHVLHLTGNVIQILKAKSFQSVGLTNLQRIYLNRCGLVSLDDEAFYQVSNLIELDLSNNFLTSVPTKALRYCPRIRKLNFAHNPIRELVNNTFAKFLHLQTIDLSDNSIESISVDAFQGSKSLKQLYLNGNKLSYLSGHCVHSLPSLYELTLHNNPWNCDCKLRDLRDWMLQHNIPLSYSPNCSTPARLSGHQWNSLQLDEFACTPTIVSIEKHIVVYEGENASIGCVISAIPAVKVEWEWRGRAIKNMSLMTFGRQMYLIKEGSNGHFQRSSTLYIMNALEKDAGSYTCVGGNKAGSISSNLTLTVIKRQTGISNYSGEEVAGMVLGTMFIFLLIFIGICVVVLRSKSHYEDISSLNRVNQNSDSNRNTEERKLLSVSMNHNSYVTSVTSNHLEMKTMGDSNQNNDKTNTGDDDIGLSDNHLKCFNSDIKSDNNRQLMIDVIDHQNVISSAVSDQQLDDCLQTDCLQTEQQFLNLKLNNTQIMNDNKSLNHFSNEDNHKVANNDKILNSVPTSSKSVQQSHQELLRRRASDITDELNQRFHQQKLSQQSPKDHHSVRFSNNATIYNYQSRFGHSMESLDSDNQHNNHNNNNQFNRNHGLVNQNNYNYPNGQLSNRSHAGLSYTLRPARISAKQWRRSGGSLAALLAIDARDSPDEGLGDEREYETDILE